jgi:hypothetical protein
MLKYVLSLFSVLPCTTSRNCCVWYIKKVFLLFILLSVCRKPNGYHCFTVSTLLPFSILVTMACQKLTTVNVHRVFENLKFP